MNVISCWITCSLHALRLQARENSSREQRREPGIFAGGTGFDHFVQMAKCESATGKTIIEFRYTERQNVPFICATPFCPFTLVEVSALATPELLVEIEAIAHIGKGARR